MMRKTLILALICAPALSLAQAPKDDLVDAAIVDACFTEARRGGIDPECIGFAADICQSRPGQANTVGISFCIMAEVAEWDRILNREYTATRDAFAGFTDGPVLTDTLLTAQRAWIALRDADCSVAYDRWGGGSMRNIASAHCQLDHTARRALDLKNMRDN